MRENEPSDYHRLRLKRFRCRCFIRSDWRKAKKKSRGWSYLNEDPNVISTNPSPIVSPQLNKDNSSYSLRLPDKRILKFSLIMVQHFSTQPGYSTEMMRAENFWRALQSWAVLLSMQKQLLLSLEDLSYSLCLPLFSSLSLRLCNGTPYFLDPDTICLLSYLSSETACMHFTKPPTKCEHNVFNLSLTMHVSRVK